jgi:hypothetical protein
MTAADHNKILAIGFAIALGIYALWFLFSTEGKQFYLNKW